MNKSFDIKTRRMLGEVIEANLNYLVRFAALRVGSKVDAEDIVHEAVRKILETDISRINTDSIRMYLFRIVYNLCKDFYINGQSVRPLTEADDEIPDTTDEERLEIEEIDRLNGILDNLPEKEAEIVRMKVMDELSFVEISQILYTPASTVKSRFKSGMGRLRKLYHNNR